MEIRTFEAKCGVCAKEFESPSLGDFSYGSFIFSTESGNKFRFFNAIEHQVTKIVEAAIPKRASFIAVVAALADPVDSEALVSHHVCPHCRASEWAYWEGAHIGAIDVQDATFRNFMALPQAEQSRQVIEAAQSVAA